jgi:hypothetical protein
MSYIDELINDFNNGDFDNIIQYFGDYQTFFEVLKRRNRVSELDMSSQYIDDVENELLLYLYETDKDKFYYWCQKYLDDVEIENGKIYCVRSSAGDFATLFCDGRDYSRDTIESILNGEWDFDWYFDDDVDVYRNVIEDLNPKNIEILKNRFISELSGIEVSPETKLLEEIAEEQGHSDYVTVDKTNIDRILNDDDSTNHLLDDEMDSDIKDELQRVYNHSTNSSLENEYYEEVWGELTSDYFDGKPEWISRNHPYKKDTKMEMVRLEIADFDTIVLDYLNENKKYGSSGTLTYQGSFLNILRDATECLRVRFPDYANYPERYINDYFADYF